MDQAKFVAVHPVLPVRNVSNAIAYYVEKLGFRLRFTDTVDTPRYAGIKRGNVTLHLQWHDAADFDKVERLNLRLMIDGIDTLFDEYRQQDVFHAQTDLRDTAWGTREFAFYDLAGNGLTFYCDLDS